jgi:hypothetical protein
MTLFLLIVVIHIGLAIFSYQEGKKREIGGIASVVHVLAFSLFGLAGVLVSPKKNEYL